MARKLPFLILALFALISGPGWGQTSTVTITQAKLELSGAYTSNTEKEVDGITYVYTDLMKSNENIQAKASTGTIRNKTAYSGNITSVAITHSGTARATTILGSSDGTNFSEVATGNGSITADFSDKGYKYFKITRGSNAAYWTKIEITYSTGSSTDPSITINPAEITWDNSPINVQLSETISVSQANLTSDITIASTIGNVSPSTIAAGENATDVTLTYIPTTTGDFEGEITFTSGETTETVTVSGSAYDPSQITTYEKVTSADDLVAGASYILICPTKNKAAGAMGANAYFSSEDATLSDNNTATSQNAIELVLGGTTGAWTFTTSEGLIGTSAAKSLNHIGNGTTTWTISIANDGTATITSTNSSYGSIKYNASSPRFLNYASEQTAVALYKKAENKAAAPTLTAATSFTTKPFEVTITNNEAGATVYYTTNGDDPTTETTTNFTDESTTIQINTTTTVKAMAVVEGKANSTIVSATYTEQKTDPENHWSVETYTATIGGENTFPTFSTLSDGAVTYTSSDANAATVDATSAITLVAAGTTTITASTAETATYMAGEASYTLTVKEAPLTTMDAIFEKAEAAGTTAKNVDVTFDNWVISGVKNDNAYLTDGTKGLIIYESGHGFEVGDILSGTTACKVKLYNGAAELINLTSSTEGLTVTEGGSVIAQEVSIADLSGINTGALITINNITYTGNDNVFTDGENEIKAYNAFMTLPSFTSGRQYNITGVYIQYGETKEIAPRTDEDIVEIVPTEPSITVAETLDLPYTESFETLEVSYENVNFDLLDLYLYDDAECTVIFENDWFDADFTADGSHNIDYIASENTESTPRTVYMQINYHESELTKVITVTQEAAPQTYNVTLSSNGVVNPQPVQGSITLSDPTNIPTGFTFAGWTESESNIQFVANPYTPTTDVTLYAVFSRVEGGIAGSGNYEKVTSALTDWSGEYLIAYSSEIFADGRTGGENGLGKLNQKVSPENNLSQDGETVSAQWGDSYQVTLEKIEGSNTYLLKTQDGKYNYQSSNTNGLASTTNRETAAQYPITVIFRSESEINLALGGNAVGAVFRYNTSGYFRFYKNGGQNPVYLYKKDEGTPGITKYYTRVYDVNTTIDDALTVQGPSIILSGKTLTVTGTMENTDPANLVIEDGAQIFQNSDGVLATIQKYITAYTDPDSRAGYHLISVPFISRFQLFSDANFLYGDYDMYMYEEETHYWLNQKVLGFQNPVFAVGYLYANSESRTVSIRVQLTPCDGLMTQYASYTNNLDVLNGFNLAGNPFPCKAYLYLCNFDDEDNPEIIATSHLVMNPAGDGFVEEPANTPIGVGEAAFVQVDGEHFYHYLFSTVNLMAEAQARLDICVSKAERGASVVNNVLVCFGEGFNTEKFMLNPENTKICIPQNGKEYGAVFAHNEGELPVNFKAEKNGTYTITVNTKNVDVEYLHLIDNMTGMDTDLLSTPSYTFDAKTSDYASRFKLVFGVKKDNEEMSQANSFAYISNGEIIISNEGRATLQVIDVLGRISSSEEINGEYRISTNDLTAGLYILSLNGMTQKIVVK